eukprot:jgi/Astpho2/1952/Aster-x0090
MSLKRICSVANARSNKRTDHTEKLKVRGRDGALRREPSRPPEVQTAPGITFDADGNIIVDESTTTIQAQAAETYTMANDDTTILTQDSYRNRPGAQRWSQEETSEFYAALQIFGTNFQLVTQRLNSRMKLRGWTGRERERREVKRKFTREEKENPSKVDRALTGQVR